MKSILIILISFLSIHQAIGQVDEKAILNQFFEVYKTDAIKAVDYIYSTNRWIDRDGDAVRKLKGQLAQYQELVGEYYGEEFLYKSELGESFVTYIYFAKYERQPFRFTFEFYKAKDKWIIYSFKFDDSFDDDLEEIMKYEYMQNRY